MMASTAKMQFNIEWQIEYHLISIYSDYFGFGGGVLYPFKEADIKDHVANSLDSGICLAFRQVK
jgi:hypothetical protein